jgi:hypothetical protein
MLSAFRSPDKLSGPSKSVKARKTAKPTVPTVLDLKVLNELAKQLDNVDIEYERKLRGELAAVERRLWMDRYEKGRILFSYRALYKPKGGWYVFCKAVGLNERSALRIIADYAVGKALPNPIRDAAQNRGIDIAAKKHRLLLEKLIELGFEDGANADDLIQRGLDQLTVKKKKSKKPACSLSPEQRFDKAYATFVDLYPDVKSASYPTELNKLYKALKSLHSGPTGKNFLVGGQQSLDIPGLEAA